jgi:hypothetical protein
MGVLNLNYKKLKTEEGFTHNSLSKKDFQSFNSSILGLGDISKDGTNIQALAAIFDLEGFTSFFNQPDPHIVVPEYLSIFLDWLFKEISDKIKKDDENENITIWGSLPFFAKFLGDGILFIWDTSYSLSAIGIGNNILILHRICKKYTSDLLPTVRKKAVKIPLRLRCGIARGQIMSIGNGQDFVGPCINIASRLQKISQLSFAFSARGVDIEKGMSPENRKLYILKKMKVRGIGDELIYFDKSEFESLSSKEKKLFREP